jgi:hypothetical protein
LVVSEQHESKKGESAVAAAARQALESTKSLPRSNVRSRSRARWLVGMSLAGAAVAAVSLPWRQEAAEPEPAITLAPETSLVETAQKVAPAAGNAAVEQDAAGVNETNINETAAAASEAVEQAAAERLASASPGTDSSAPDSAGPRPRDTASITTGSATPAGSAPVAGSVSAGPFAASPAKPGTGAGELVPSSSAPEIEVVELETGEPASADDDDQKAEDTAATSNTTAAKTPRVKRRSASQKQSAEYYQTGDCAMPHWAWRVFGFQEPKRKRGCGG